MLIEVNELKSLYPQFSDIDERVLERKLKAIENAIRAYTNNNFQNRAFREACAAVSNRLITASGTHRFKVGDTIQISVNDFNKGLYKVVVVGADYIEVNTDLYESIDNLVTKVEYPFDVIEGAINVLNWDTFERDKLGISSETISRHSVSYQTYDSNNTISGYPAVLFGFAKPYMRARV